VAKKPTSKPTISIVGPGNLGSALAAELTRAGYAIRYIVTRPSSKVPRPKALARRVKAQHVFLEEHKLDTDIIWITVPDDAISEVAKRLAASQPWKRQIFFHSSGALSSEELQALSKKGASVASVHPMMTFVAGKKPQWRGVAFAIEGDDDAVRAATQIAGDLGGAPFEIEKRNKVLYHAFGSFASPLVIALLATMEQVAQAAGIPADKAKKMMMPLLSETLNNYVRQDAANAFSGPLVRGDVHTIRKHLAHLKRVPDAREVYLALARVAIKRLPAKNKEALTQELLIETRTRPAKRDSKSVAKPGIEP
jgi:predicted short-subunit dehydrogenase-like oxidoreductase (DUF2520 family)